MGCPTARYPARLCLVYLLILSLLLPDGLPFVYAACGPITAIVSKTVIPTARSCGPVSTTDQKAVQLKKIYPSGTSSWGCGIKADVKIMISQSYCCVYWSAQCGPGAPCATESSECGQINTWKPITQSVTCDGGGDYPKITLDACSACCNNCTPTEVYIAEFSCGGM